jgi:hypothetical protein
MPANTVTKLDGRETGVLEQINSGSHSSVPRNSKHEKYALEASWPW